MAFTTGSSSDSSRERVTNVSEVGAAASVAVMMSWRARIASRRSAGGARVIEGRASSRDAAALGVRRERRAQAVAGSGTAKLPLDQGGDLARVDLEDHGL